LDAKVGEREQFQYIDTLTSADEQIDERLARSQLQGIFNKKLEEFSQTLSERELVILQERLIAEEPRTLQEIADRFGVTREAIRLNEKTLISRIKKYMESVFAGVTDVEFAMLNQ
jgi:RNA polymerase sigma-32 factor